MSMFAVGDVVIGVGTVSDFTNMGIGKSAAKELPGAKGVIESFEQSDGSYCVRFEQMDGRIRSWWVYHNLIDYESCLFEVNTDLGDLLS